MGPRILKPKFLKGGDGILQFFAMEIGHSHRVGPVGERVQCGDAYDHDSDDRRSGEQPSAHRPTPHGIAGGSVAVRETGQVSVVPGRCRGEEVGAFGVGEDLGGSGGLPTVHADQVGAHSRGGLVSVLGVLGQRLEDHRIQLRGDAIAA